VRATLLFVAVSWFVLAIIASAQTNTAQLTGRITDKSGGVVQGAHVVAINMNRGNQRETTANEEGYYSCPLLPPGDYRIAVEMQGFKPSVRSGVRLGIQQVVRVDFVLELGEISQALVVNAPTPVLNTENAQLGDVRSREDLLNLPINDRSTIKFFFLSSFNYQGDGSSYSLGGLRGVNTNFTLDGVTSNSALFGGQVGPMTEMSLEAVRELKMMSSNSSAEFPGVGTVMVSSRAGENQHHGSAFAVTGNNALNARNPFSPAKPKGPIQHEFGGGLGGPLTVPELYDGHDRTFYYLTWEQQRFPGAYTGTASVPTLKMRMGDFSELLPEKLLLDPLAGEPFPGNRIPLERMSPVALRMQEFGFLKPNYGPAEEFSANWRGVFPSNGHNDRYVIRLDHQLSRSDVLSFRLSLRSIPLPGGYDADLPVFRHDQQRRTRNAYVSDTHVFSGQLLNEFRLGFSRDYSRLAGVHRGAELLEQFGLHGIDVAHKQDLSGVPGVKLVNFSAMSEFPSYFWMTETYEFLDNLTYTNGRHSWKTGTLARRNRGNISSCCDSDFGTLSFDGFATGFDYADFLLGLPQSTRRFHRSQPRYNRYSELGLYLQDDLRLTPRLSLNLGIRYEYFSPPVDKFDMRFSFDPRIGNLIVTNQDALQRLVNPFFPKSIPIVTAQQAGFPARSLLESHHRNFGPRFGFALRFFNNTVLRGGYGIYFTRLSSTLMENFGGGPFQVKEEFQNKISQGVPLFQFPTPFSATGEIPAQSIFPVSKNLLTPYTQQWNLTLERELPASVVARLSYRGFRTLQLPYSGDINKPSPNSRPEAAGFFRYPQFYQVVLAQSGGKHKLHALDAAVERKFAEGLSFQSGWTWAKGLTDVGDDGESVRIENPYDRQREMADVAWMPRHRFVSQALLDLPLGAQKRFGSNLPGGLQHLLGNWQISAVTVFKTGQFLTPVFSGADPSNTRTQGGRPDRIASGNLQLPTIARWFDANAFVLPPNGRFGNSARGVIVGPGLGNFDFGLHKYFSVKEKGRLQLRMTATNFFNHPNYDNPNLDISSQNVGKITRLQGSRRDTLGGGPRTIQLGLRFDF